MKKINSKMQGGLIGLFGLLLLLLIKSIITYVVTFLEYNLHITAIFSTLLYFIPLLIVLFLIIIYQKFTKFALITGFIIAILDFLDYSVAIFIKIASGIDGKFYDTFKMVITQILIWLPVRIYVLSYLYKAIKWWKKINEKKEEEYKNEKSI